MIHHYLVNQTIVTSPLAVQMDDLYDEFLKEIGFPGLPTAGDAAEALQKRANFMADIGPTRTRFLSWLRDHDFTIIEPVQTIRILS
jgi:hypothetical protein